MKARRPPRLERVYQSYDPPLYFVTFCTHERRKCLADDRVNDALVAYAERAEEIGAAAVGRYVIMPDHVHLFVRLAHDHKLGQWVKGLKRAISVSLKAAVGPARIWQAGFFDHVLRNSESYSEKWKYVRDNPVRAGLVENPEDWPYQGEIIRIDRV